MPQFPGELTPSEQQEWEERFRRMAVERWGEAHAAEIAGALREAALATGAVMKLDFVSDEAPGFYMAAHYDEVVGEWRVG